jgi:choline dehydrogenase-like flavoprotein
MAIIDGRTLPDGHQIEADLCIIGAGAAGLTIARELAGRAATVAILESGGLEPDASIQNLNAGEVAGVPYVPLEHASLRGLGGTTHHWTAWVRPLAAIVFEPRPWIPHSGWPIGARDLAACYDRALRFLKVPESAFDVGRLTRQGGPRPWRFSGDEVTTEVLHIVAAENRPFAARLRRLLESERNLRVHLFATVLEIRPDPEVRRVVQLQVGTPEGKRFTARARYYVLAGGAIENARLLLLSNGVQAAGLANGKDLVGRFFANHPTADGLQVQPARADLAPAFYGRRPQRAGASYAYLAPSEELQKRARLPRVRFQLRSSPGPGTRRRSELSPAGADPEELRRSLARVLADLEECAGADARDAAPPAVALSAVYEPFPEPDNRVRLGDARDAFGQRRAVLEWRFGEDFRDRARRCLVTFATALARSGIGRLRVPALDLQCQATFHHMGTTRMHPDPSRGVVDAACRVHGIDNLFIAGASVFPCYGVANPTLTIMALASRLADHLRGLLDAA